MLQTRCKFSANSRRFLCICCIAVYWVSGYLIGTLISRSTLLQGSALAITLLQRSFSLVGIFVVALIPITYLYLALRFKHALSVYLFWIAKGIGCGFTASLFLSIWDNASWLLYGLSAFSSISLSVPMSYLCLCRIDNDDRSFSTSLIPVLLAAGTICLVDLLWISPSISLLQIF